MSTTRRLFAGIFVAIFAFPGTGLSATCHDKSIEARGEPSTFVWLAKIKARANWRREVRETSGLGADWAVWGQAADTEERCLTGPEGALCIFIGTPCKP